MDYRDEPKLFLIEYDPSQQWPSWSYHVGWTTYMQYDDQPFCYSSRPWLWN